MKIICFGDSLTSCGGKDGRFSDILQDRFPEHVVVNAGKGGETLEDGRARLRQDVLTQSPDVVLVEFGANDWWRNERPISSWTNDMHHILTAIQDVGAISVIVGVFGPYRDDDGNLMDKEFGTDDRGHEWFAAKQELAKEFDSPHVWNVQERIGGNRCCWRDRNHPNEYGNRFVADAIEPILETLLDTRAAPIRKPNLTTLVDIWEEAVSLAPNALAVCDPNWRLTYDVANVHIRNLSKHILRITRSTSPTVAVHSSNRCEYFLIYWATILSGGTIVPLNTWLKKDALSNVLRSVEADVLYVERETAAVTTATKRLDNVIVISMDDLMDFTEGVAEDFPIANRPVADDIAIIMHTSGTTALPKGAIMRHGDLLFNVMTTINAQGFVPGDVHLVVNPMFHATALYSSLPTAAYQKSSLVITRESSADRLLSIVHEQSVTTFLTVPSILRRIAGVPDISAYATQTLRLIGYAGSPMPIKTIQRLHEQFPETSLRNFFGLTETISATHAIADDNSLERPASIGRPLPFVESIVVDENNCIAPPNTIGELLFARKNVICDYWKQPGRLEKSLMKLNGRQWFRTGDLATVDDDGFYEIKGRKKDMIIVGGENVYSVEVEAVLNAHPDVVEAAVVGIPASGIRESLGEFIKAVVVSSSPGLTERDVMKHCHHSLISYQIPQIVEFRDALPRTPTGKVLKEELK